VVGVLWLQIKQGAFAVGLNYDYAREIVKTYNQQGIAVLANRRKQPGRPGRAPLLNPEQLRQLQQALRRAPADGGLWSGPKVAQWIAEQTGLSRVRAQRGWDYLKRCRCSPQRPRPRHTQADAQAQATFQATLQQHLEQIQQHHPEATIQLWAFDEHRLGVKPIRLRVWAPVGERPVARVNHH